MKISCALQRLLKISIFLIISVFLTACVTTNTPKVSHVHVGHAMTAWRDTPNEQGLFITAEQEGIVAYEQAQLAVKNSHDRDLMNLHVKSVLHAMKPVQGQNAQGLGYGFIKAINASRDHILFAADSKDASDNIKSSAQRWSMHVDKLIERSQLVVALSKDVLKSSSQQDRIILTDEIKNLTQQNLYGYDSDGDGSIGNVNSDYGIKQLKAEIMTMIENEDPPYQTVDKKYLFGLIRLPSGEWIFNFDNTSKASGFQY